MNAFMAFLAPSKNARHVLTNEQRQMYAAEKLENFRWISKLVASYSPYVLSKADFAPGGVTEEIAELGQFAELAYTTLPLETILLHLDTLQQPRYPLESYHALEETTLIHSFRGTCANLPVYVAFRTHQRQLVVGTAGTTCFKQALQDLRVIRIRHPSKRGYVHAGFWDLYQGVRDQALQAIEKGLSGHEVSEVVLTGHSMGGSVSYLLCLDLLSGDLLPRHKPKLKVVTFGAPRTGEADLVKYFRDLVDSYRQTHGPDAFTELAVKGYNDGVPALPPVLLGYRHFARQPFYTENDRVYQTPASESEHALFRIQEEEDHSAEGGMFPMGGHNYYNGRDLERFLRRMAWLDQANMAQEGWEQRYLALVPKDK